MSLTVLFQNLCEALEAEIGRRGITSFSRFCVPESMIDGALQKRGLSIERRGRPPDLCWKERRARVGLEHLILLADG